MAEAGTAAKPVEKIDTAAAVFISAASDEAEKMDTAAHDPLAKIVDDDAAEDPPAADAGWDFTPAEPPKPLTRAKLRAAYQQAGLAVAARYWHTAAGWHWATETVTGGPWPTFDEAVADRWRWLR